MTTTASQAAAPATHSSLDPADVLLNLIIMILAPMFVTASNGDILFAHMVALGTVNAYQARNEADLIGIAQIIACGLTASGSLNLSVATICP